jgi:O-antigen/teichoic acid export membrane protein|tara:strand:- start:174 stop:1631 length:1458 start_codon:yes stop_codon:yes gene_type:complete
LGIVLKQSFINTLIIYLSFIVGGINVIILYPQVLEGKYFGIVVYLLSVSNIIMPLVALGVQHTIVKFFSSYDNKKEKDKFLSIIIFLPLLIAIPIGFFVSEFYEQIGNRISKENPILKDYTFVIFAVAISTTYFEVFYSWAKVHMQSIFGNILKEFWNRAVVLMLLLAVSFDFLTKPQFIYFLTGAYAIRAFIMMFYAFWLYFPKFTFQLPNNFKEVFRYSLYMVLAGSAGAILLDIDKVMIPDKETVEVAAYYAVAVFIGSVIEAPGRAMAQILQPITSKIINENNPTQIESLYKKSSINLLLISGLFFLLVNCGVHELFKLMPDKGYAGGELVVLMISGAKMFTMFLGNNGAIINNSVFYRITLPLNLGMAFSVYYLNVWLFEIYGTNGLALATLIVIFAFNIIKLLILKINLNITPITNKTFISFLMIAVLFFTFYFWNFQFHPIVNIALKTLLITGIYLFAAIKLKISLDINKLLSRFIKI